MTEGALKKWESARSLLAQAARIDEVAHVRGLAQQAMLYARQAKDRELMAHAMEIQQRAERKLGELLRKAGEMGLISKGGRPRGAGGEAAEKGTFGQALAEAIERAGGEPDEAAEKTSAGAEEVFEPIPFTLADVGIDHKLSAKAQKLAGLDEAAFEAGIARAREKILSGGAAVVNPVKDISTAAKKEARAAREAELGARQAALPQKRYGVIYADPEWRFEPYSRQSGMDRAADNHYPTSPLAAIKARPVAEIAADDCALFLWATVPMLPEALEVLGAWGFSYRSHFVWLKREAGTGYWNRNQHELLLIGTRGNVPAPAPGTQFRSALAADQGAHSEKPAFGYEIIEAYFPTLPKIELNARRRREGWDAWGLEAPAQPEDVAGGNILAESGLSHAKPGEEAPEALAQPEDNSESRAPAGGPVEAGGAVPSASPASPADSAHDLVATVLALRPDCLVPECCRSPGGRALCHSCAKAKERGSVDLPAFLPRRPAEAAEEAS